MLGSRQSPNAADAQMANDAHGADERSDGRLVRRPLGDRREGRHRTAGARPRSAGPRGRAQGTHPRTGARRGAAGRAGPGGGLRAAVAERRRHAHVVLGCVVRLRRVRQGADGGADAGARSRARLRRSAGARARLGRRPSPSPRCRISISTCCAICSASRRTRRSGKAWRRSSSARSSGARCTAMRRARTRWPRRSCARRRRGTAGAARRRHPQHRAAVGGAARAARRRAVCARSRTSRSSPSIGCATRSAPASYVRSPSCSPSRRTRKRPGVCASCCSDSAPPAGSRSRS